MKIKIFFQLFMLVVVCTGKLAYANSESAKPFTPFRIAGNLYYVGDSYQANYLIVTSKGNILINSGFEENVPMIKASIEKLGFKFSDTKILLLSQAHNDHGGGSALIKKNTNAAYMVMDADVSVVESGGKTDFQYGNKPSEQYKPTKVDRVLHDKDEVKLGETVLVAHLTPGHTKGCTTWTMQITENGKTYHIVIVGGPYVNSGYKLIDNSSYPNIAQDYERMWSVLKQLPCDIFLGAHGVYYGLEAKYALMKQSEMNPFIDGDGYQKFIAEAEKQFRTEFKKQKN